MPSVNLTQPTNYASEAERIARNRKLAEALQAQSAQETQGNMVGGWYVKPSWTQHLAKVLQGVSAGAIDRRADDDSKALAINRNEALVRALGGMPTAQAQALPTDQEGTGSFDMSGTSGPDTRLVSPTMTQNAQWLGQLGQIGPDAVAMGSGLLGMQQKAEENQLTRENQLTQRAMALEAQAAQAGANRELQASLAAQTQQARREAEQARQEFARQQAEAQRVFAAQQTANQRGFQASQAAEARAARPPQIIQTESGPMQVTGNQAAPIMGPDGQPVKGRGLEKALPTSAAQKLMENQQNLRRAEQALALIQGNSVGEAKGDPNATGWKGMLPDFLLQRVDPQGVDARAAIGDLGSLVIHDRSGAAVTAAEFPRLKPFIPTVTDDAATVKKKLDRFVREYRNIVQEATDFYRESGYKVPTETLRGVDTDATPQRRATDDPLGLRN